MRWRSVAYRWFVEYNPLYFASALCVFAGVFLIARELPPDDFAAKLGIAASTEAYQFLLMGGAWLLLRAGSRRAAALLGLVALLFLLDGALNGERIFSHARTMSLAPGMRARQAVPATLALAFLAPVKVWMLARLYRLRQAGSILLPSALLIALMPLLPYVIEAAGPAERPGAHLAVFWLGAPLFGWGFTKAARGWTSRWARDVLDHVRVSRIAGAAPFIVVALFVVHGAAWSTFPGLGLSPAHVAPYVLAAACAIAGRLALAGSRGAELIGWAGAAAALLATAISPPVTGSWPMGAVALMTGASLLALVLRTRLRLLLPATVCMFGGVYIFAAGLPSTLPAPGAEWPGALALVLLAGAARHRDFRCLFASAVAAGGALVAVHPQAGLPPYGLLVLGTWLAGWSWVFFPELRRWVPFAATAGVLALGAVMLHRQPAALAPWYAATAAAAFGVGTTFRMKPFQWAGLAGFGPLAVEMRARWVPQTGGGWGVALLVAGFLFLCAGVAFNLLLARRPQEEPEPRVSE